ncbi:secreted protein, putative, partial [Ixodes scapularis]
IKMMFLTIFAAVLTLHVFVDDILFTEHCSYCCYLLWQYRSISCSIMHFILSFQGFFFFNLHTCSARCISGQIERRLPPGIICDPYNLVRRIKSKNNFTDCLGDIGQNSDPLVCTGCTPEVYDKLRRWQSG